MAKATQLPEKFDHVFISDPDCPANYGQVTDIQDGVYTVACSGGTYETSVDYLEVDFDLPF